MLAGLDEGRRLVVRWGAKRKDVHNAALFLISWAGNVGGVRRGQSVCYTGFNHLVLIFGGLVPHRLPPVSVLSVCRKVT